MKKSLSVVLPAYNEEGNIYSVVTQAVGVLEDLKIDHEIIVVNDGSRDKTGEIADQLAKNFSQVRVIHHPQNRGYGGALTSGFKAAKNDLVFFTDADRQFDIGEITKLLPYVSQYDIIAGYRIKRADPWHRHLIGIVYNLLVTLLFGVRLKDMACAFKIYKRGVLDSIHFETVGALINTEIMLKAKMRGYSVKEVGVSHFPRVSGEQTGASLPVIWRAFRETLKLWWKYRVRREAIK